MCHHGLRLLWEPLGIQGLPKIHRTSFCGAWGARTQLRHPRVCGDDQSLRNEGNKDEAGAAVSRSCEEHPCRSFVAWSPMTAGCFLLVLCLRGGREDVREMKDGL